MHNSCPRTCVTNDCFCGDSGAVRFLSENLRKLEHDDEDNNDEYDELLSLGLARALMVPNLPLDPVQVRTSQSPHRLPPSDTHIQLLINQSSLLLTCSCYYHITSSLPSVENPYTISLLYRDVLKPKRRAPGCENFVLAVASQNKSTF